MKPQKLACLFLALTVAASSAFLLGGQFIVVNSSTTVPIKLTNVTFQVRQATLLGKKGPRTDNAGDIYVSPISGDETQGFKIAPGEQAVISPPSGGANLSEWFLDVSVANDGVIIIYH